MTVDAIVMIGSLPMYWFLQKLEKKKLTLIGKRIVLDMYEERHKAKSGDEKVDKSQQDIVPQPDSEAASRDSAEENESVNLDNEEIDLFKTKEEDTIILKDLEMDGGIYCYTFAKFYTDNDPIRLGELVLKSFLAFMI